MSLNISLIRASFDEVKPIANEVVSHFYKTLFESYPAAKPLFAKTDMEGQKKALIGSLVNIVDNLDNSAVLVPYLKKMGARHVKYGTEEAHYPLVANSLMSTFRHFFGNNWSPELEEQWTLALSTIADCMIQGAQEAQEEAKNARPQASTQRVYELPPHSKGDGQDLSQMARQLARNLLFKVLEQEAEGEFMKLARKKASNILSQALREEAEQIQEQFNGKKKVS